MIGGITLFGEVHCIKTRLKLAHGATPVLEG